MLCYLFLTIKVNRKFIYKNEKYLLKYRQSTTFSTNCNLKKIKNLNFTQIRWKMGCWTIKLSFALTSLLRKSACFRTLLSVERYVRISMRHVATVIQDKKCLSFFHSVDECRGGDISFVTSINGVIHFSLLWNVFRGGLAGGGRNRSRGINKLSAAAPRPGELRFNATAEGAGYGGRGVGNGGWGTTANSRSCQKNY